MPRLLSRFLQRRQGNWQSLQGKPSRERHVVSFMFNVGTILLLCISLGLPWWSVGKTSDGSCSVSYGLAKVSVVRVNTPTDFSLSDAYKPAELVLISCVFCFLVCTFILQVIAAVVSAGYPRERFEFIRHFSIFNIVSLICLVAACGFWLWVSEQLNTDTKFCVSAQKSVTLTISFHAGFYLCVGAGAFSLVALSVNMICARSAVDRRRRERQRLRQGRGRTLPQFLSRNQVEMTNVHVNARENMLQRVLSEHPGALGLGSSPPANADANETTNRLSQVSIDVPPSLDTDTTVATSTSDLTPLLLQSDAEQGDIPSYDNLQPELPPLDLEILSQEIDILATRPQTPPLAEGENPPPYEA